MGLAELRQQQMSGDEMVAFEEEVSRRSKSVFIGYALWLLLGWHYAYAGKWGTQVLFWATGGGFLLWWLVDIFRVPGIVASYNEGVADEIALQVAALRPRRTSQRRGATCPKCGLAVTATQSECGECGTVLD